jgi:hypothetical protein
MSLYSLYQRILEFSMDFDPVRKWEGLSKINQPLVKNNKGMLFDFKKEQKAQEHERYEPSIRYDFNMSRSSSCTVLFEEPGKLQEGVRFQG